jgi:HEAT repeat protein
VLKQHATTGAAIAFHETIALALVGEVDFLLNLARKAKTRDIAIRGIASLYSVLLSECQQPHRLDYRPVERLLEMPDCQGRVSKLFSGPCAIGPEDVEEALRGLESKHAVIREHAVCVLGERKLGAAAAARVLPALAARLGDKSATVRRLAILSLSDWKKAAKPYAADIRRLFKDPSPDVADYARTFVKAVE